MLSTLRFLFVTLGWLGCSSFVLFAPLAHATPSQGSGPHVRVELISESQSIQAGKDFYVGFYFQLEKNWHIYWQNPGDSGTAPKVGWKLSQGVTAQSILWPIPMRIPVGPLVNYGYENEVFLMVPMHANESVNGLVQLEGDLSWLVCRESCVPGESHLELHLPVTQGAAQADSKWLGIFSATRQMLPMDPPTGWKLTGSSSNSGNGGSKESKYFQLFLNLGWPVEEATFFPLIPNQVENAETQKLSVKEGVAVLDVPRSDLADSSISSLSGLLLVSGKNMPSDVGYRVDIPLSQKSMPMPDLLGLLVLAWIGGLILNFMPCVFPVLAIKVMGLVQLSGSETRKMRNQAWMYALGNLVAFWALAGTLLVLRAAGQQIGWGFQLQSPQFLVVMALVLFFFGLNLLGIFEIDSAAVTGLGQNLTNRQDYVGSFFTGVFATLVATPCTAPFMGSAVGFALTQPSLSSILIFTVLAIGFAFPFIVLAYCPGLVRLMPRPGKWMETLKQFMSFLIFGTVIWLAWILSLESSPSILVTLMVGFLMIGFSAWLLNRWQRLPWVKMGAFTLVAASIGVVAQNTPTVQMNQNLPGMDHALAHSDDDLPWEKFSPEKLKEYRSQGKPVFIDFTASWCVSCKVNEMLVFRSEAVKKKLKEVGVVLLKADWTTQDPVISKTLASFGRSGVPFYVIYGKGKNSTATPLPEVINADLVLRELDKL